MRLFEITSDDPIGDLIQRKIQPDSGGLDALVNKFMSADEPKTTGTRPVKTAAQTAPVPTAPSQPTRPAAPAPAPKPVVIQQAPGSVPWQQVRDYLASKGLSKPHVIGMLANIDHESKFKPQALVTDSNGLPSGGLFQHNGPRLQALMNKLGNAWNQNWKGQIDYALGEPDGQRYVGQKFQNPNQAAKWWTLNFERPAHKQQVAQVRSQTANKYKLAR